MKMKGMFIVIVFIILSITILPVEQATTDLAENELLKGQYEELTVTNNPEDTT